MSIFVVLIPPTLVLGPFIPDLLLCLSSLIILFNYFYYKDKDIDLKNNIIIYLFLFYIYSLIRSLFSDNIFLSLESSLFYFRFIIFIIVINFLIKKSINFTYKFYI